LSRAADGSMRDALSLTDQVLALDPDATVTADRVRDALGLVPEDEYLAILDLIAARKAGEIFIAIARLADQGIDFGLLLSGIADTIRAQLAVVLGATPPDISASLLAALTARRSAWAAGDLLRMLHAITELEQQFRKSVQQQLLLETLLVRFALLDRSVELEAVLRGFGSSGGGTSPAPRPTPPTVKPEGKWEDVVKRLRGASPMLAAALDSAKLVDISQEGDLTISLEEANEVFQRKIEGGREQILAAAREVLGKGKSLKLALGAAGAPPPPKLTHETLKTEEVARLRRSDALLNKAIDALDLELMDE
jgi:DNA polymerase III gamma/tau subunit